MAETRARDLAKSLGQAVRTNNIASDGSLTGGIEVYDSSGLLPTSYDSANSGQQAFTKDSDRLYIHTGQGWFNIAIVNTTPIFTTSPAGSYELATDATAYKNGTATTVTIQARDSEGFPVTYAATGNSAFNNIAYVDKDSAAGFIFTVEPKSQDSVGEASPANGILTFTATDGINIASAASTFSLIFDLTIANSENTVLLTKAVGDDGINTTIVDSNGTGNTRQFINDGSPQQGTFSPYSPSGYSWYFAGPGASNGVSTTDLSIGSSEQFTMEAWINHDCTTSGALFNFAINTSTLTFMLYLGLTSSSKVGLKLHAGSELINISSETIERDKWYHIALTRQSDNNLRLYVDGSLKGTSSSTYTAALGAATWFGKWYNDNTYNYKGYVNDWRVVKGKAVYTGNFTPPNGKLTKTGGAYPSDTNITNPTGSETKLLLCNNPMFEDIETGLTITDINSNIETIPYTPYKVIAAYSAATHGGSIRCYNGSGVRVDHHSDMLLGTDDMCVEWWMYAHDIPTSGSPAVITHGWDAAADTSSNWIFGFDLGDGDYGMSHFAQGVSGGNWSLSTGYTTTGRGGSTNNYPAIQITEKQWYHIAYVRNGTSFKIYANGKLYASATSNLNFLNNTDDFSIGTSAAGNNNTADISFSDVRYVIGAPVYTGDFTPPSGPLTTTSGTYPSNTNVNTIDNGNKTKILLKGVNGKILDEGGRHNLQLVGNAKSDTGVQKYSIPSMIFDGNGDYVEATETKLFQHRAAPFTFEAWIYTSSTGQQTIMMTGSSSSDTLNMFYLSGQLCLYDDNTNLTTAGGAISQNTWTHVAAVRNNGRIKTYINGVQGADVAYATDTAHTIMRIGGHINGSNWFQGNISDARITKSSRYPFVPLKETLTTSTSFQSGITLTASNTKLLTAHAASITDGSATGHTVTANGNAAVSNFAPIGGMKSVYLDGTGDYLSVSSNAEFGFGTGDFTIECWFYNSAANYDNYPNIFAQVTEGSTNFRLFIFSNKFRWRAANTNAMDGTTTLEVKKWYHVALVRKSGTTRIFLNGSVEGNTYSDSVNYSADAIHIGKRGSSDGYYLTGYISNFRIVKGQAIYDKDFTPPAIALAG